MIRIISDPRPTGRASAPGLSLIQSLKRGFEQRLIVRPEQILGINVSTSVVIILSLGLAFAAAPAAAQRNAQTAETEGGHPGQAVYQQFCSTCHNDPNMTRAHSLDSLQLMNADRLTLALTEGVMAAQGSALSDEQREQVIDWLAIEDNSEAWVVNNLCEAEKREVDLSATRTVSHIGIDSNNSRYLSGDSAGLKREDMADLELAWAVGFPGTGQLRGSPAVIGSTLFYAATGTDKVVAIDGASGCLKWTYDSPNPLRSPVVAGELGAGGPVAILLGDARGFVHAIDARNGKQIWIVDGKAESNGGMITGSVVLHENRIIVPISASGVTAGANPRFECCEGHGAVTALDAATGEKIWEYHTMPPAEYTGETSSMGVKLRGPSGAPIWSTPPVDAGRNSVYVTTGENTSHPPTGTSDAIIALDLSTGEEKWVFQALERDVWNMACSLRGPNCPDQQESALVDYDFGGSAILVEDAGGRDLLLAGQKSGDLWALDPDTGQVAWNQRIGQGTALGGNHWGIATDGRRAYHAISDPDLGDDHELRPGMYSFFVGSGEPSWSYEVQADCSGNRQERSPLCDSRFGFSATPLVVDGAVITAGLDGRLFVLDSDSGEVLFKYDTNVEFETTNGVEGAGGAIDSHGLGAGAGMIFVSSGYSSFSQPAGNVLLAFRPRQD